MSLRIEMGGDCDYRISMHGQVIVEEGLTEPNSHDKADNGVAEEASKEIKERGDDVNNDLRDTIES